MPTKATDFLPRIEQLERQNQRMKLAGLAVLSFLTVAFLVGQAVPKDRIVEAEKFVLKDKKGMERATLGLSKDGSVGLHLTDTDGKTRLKLSVLENYSARLELLDPKERNRVELVYHEVTNAFTRDGKHVEERFPSCGLNLNDGHGEPQTELPRAALLLDHNGSPYLGFRTKDGKVSWEAEEDKK